MQATWRSPWRHLLPMLVGALVGAAIVLTSQLQRCSGTSWHQAPACGGCGAAAPAAQRPYYAIALATGLKPIELNVFVQSWRRFSPQTTLVIYGDAGVQELYRGQPAVEVVVVDPSPSQAVHPQVLRLHLYQAYLQQLLHNGSADAGIVLSDSRDAFIQADPWAEPAVQQLLSEDAMLFSLEGGPELGNVSIREERTGWNSLWVERCFGRGVLEEIGNSTVSCSGVTVGSLAAVSGYIDTMVTVTNTTSDECRATSGADQGIHNYVLHYLGARGELPFKFRVADNQASPVHTAQYGWPVTINRFGALRRAAGSRLPVPPIVHQYDRLWPVKQLAQGLYPVLGSELTYAKEMYAADPAMVLPGCQPPPDQALPQQ